MCLALFLVSKCQGPSPLLLSLSLTTKIPDLLSVSICPRGSAMRRHGGRSGGGGRGGAWLWVSSLGSFNCFVPLSQQRKKEREKQRRKERKSPPKEHIPKKKRNQTKTKPNQTTNSNIPNTRSQRVTNMDILFISLVTWSYKHTWQNPPRTQKNRTLMNQCEVRSHDILGGQKHNGNLAQCC